MRARARQGRRAFRMSGLREPKMPCTVFTAMLASRSLKVPDLYAGYLRFSIAIYWGGAHSSSSLVSLLTERWD